MVRKRNKSRRLLDYSYIDGGFRISVCFHFNEEWWRAYDRESHRLVYEAVWLGSVILDEQSLMRRREFMGKFTAKALEARRKQAGTGKAPPEKLFSDFPAVREFMTDPGDEKEGHRLRSPLSLSWGEGGYKACLREPNEGLVLFSTGATLYLALEGLESQLQSEAPDWRKDFFHEKNGKRKK